MEDHGWDAVPRPADVQRLGPYRLVQRVGAGGMGVVHLGLDASGRAVAVKVLRPHVAEDPAARHRLAREVSTLQRVRHPRVAEVLDADTVGEQPYVVTRYVPAPPLDDHVRLRGPLTGGDLARLADGLGEALAAIHAAGVVHRDLKPGNVLMDEGEPVVIDFGIAHVADDVRLTSTGLVMGTPGYLSPEVLDGNPATHATDWWGWAATLAFAATGRPPFGRGPVDAVLDRVRRGDVDLDGVPAALAPVLERSLVAEPWQRPHPTELRAAVRDLWLASRVPLREDLLNGRGHDAADATQVVHAPVDDRTAAIATPRTRVLPVEPSTTPVPRPAPYASAPSPAAPSPAAPSPAAPSPAAPSAAAPLPAA
ncbi:serine/threonine-protein kinase, partial [Thalassiella azotivora]